MKATWITQLILTVLGSGWICHATDYQGSFGDGYGATKSEAQLQAIDACMQRSRRACSISACFEQR